MTYEEQDKHYHLHTYKRKYVNFTHGKNAKLFDESGAEYIDFTAGVAVASVGHGNERLAKSICEQASKILHISNLYFIEPQAKLAQKIVELSGLDARVFFANSGAEANEGAIKMARKYGEKDGYPKRHKIITLRHSFHGRTITTLKATAQDKFHAFFGPYTDSFAYADDIEEVYSLIDHETVAVMIEPVQGEGGVNAFEIKAIRDLAELLKERDILLIIDEIQTGVYRIGDFLASSVYGVEPDIVTLAKGLAGGVPIGAIVTKLKDIFSYGDHGSTFGGNYLSTSSALTVLEILEEHKQSGKLQEAIRLFDYKTNEILKRFPALFAKRTGAGLLLGLRTESDDVMAKVIEAAFEERLLLLKAGLSTVRFAPPLTIMEEETVEGFDRLERALKRLA